MGLRLSHRLTGLAARPVRAGGGVGGGDEVGSWSSSWSRGGQEAQVAQDLAAAGFVDTQRGRGGGLRLARPAADINVGAVVRSLEHFDGFVACMGGKAECMIDGACGLKPALAGALEAFLTHLDGFTLADIAADRTRLLDRLTPQPA